MPILGLNGAKNLKFWVKKRRPLGRKPIIPGYNALASAWPHDFDAISLLSATQTTRERELIKLP